MSLLSEAKGLTVQTGGRCTVYLLEQTLEPAELADLRQSLNDPDPQTGKPVPATAIARTLAGGYFGDRGRGLHALAIQRHRRGDCRCR